MSKAKELIENNTLTNITVESDGVVYQEIAMTAISLSEYATAEKWRAEMESRINDLKEKALNAFLECEGYDDFERAINE